MMKESPFTDNKCCPTPGCPCIAQRCFSGFCASCWVKLTPEQRAVALGEEPPVKEIITHREVIHDPRSKLLMALLWLWGIAMTGAVVWMAWRK
jgi:hypothetical protein